MHLFTKIIGITIILFILDNSTLFANDATTPGTTLETLDLNEQQEIGLLKHGKPSIDLEMRD